MRHKLDVISLSENQHSDILAWMLDAREGHGQGGEILRDLLVSASTRAASGESGLDGSARRLTPSAVVPKEPLGSEPAISGAPLGGIERTPCFGRRGLHPRRTARAATGR